MSVIVNKVAPSIMLCPEALRTEVNNNVNIAPFCENITVTNEVNIEFIFTTALTVSEDLELDLVVDSFVCPPGTGGTPGGIDPSAGIIIERDGTPLISDVTIINFEGAVATTDDLSSKATVHIGHLFVKNGTGSSIAGGTPVYSTGFDIIKKEPIVAPADASQVGKMPALGIMEKTVLPGNSELVVISGEVDGIDTSSFLVSSPVYVAPGGGLTTTRPSGAGNLVQKMGQVAISDITNGEIIVIGAGRTNDVPNITKDFFWVGDSNDVAVPTKLTSLSIPPVSVLPSTTKNIDIIPVSDIRAVKWLITVMDVVTLNIEASEIYALHTSGITSHHNIEGIIGDTSINYVIDVVISGTDLVLVLTNNEPTNTLTVNTTRIPIYS